MRKWQVIILAIGQKKERVCVMVSVSRNSIESQVDCRDENDGAASPTTTRSNTNSIPPFIQLHEMTVR